MPAGLAGLLLLVSCGGAGDPTGAAAPNDGIRGRATVSAAASLTESFTAIGEAFEQAHPGTSVTFTFDSSDRLAAQIIEGAPVDVFASASPTTTEEVVDVGLVTGGPTAFAGNRITIVTRPGNPAGIRSLADLVDAGVVALCGEGAPCGVAAATVLDAAGVSLPEDRVTRGQNVKATLSAVSQGDAVAGLVYATDARAAGDAVEAVALPRELDALTRYPIAVLDGPGDDAVAEAFVDLVLGPEGQRILADAGFLPPS